MKPFQQVSDQLAQLFFLPFRSNETPELRAKMIECYLKESGWDWDSYLDKSWSMEMN